MAEIKFFTNTLNVPANSAVGFYGDTFGASVSVGSYNENTYITNPAGNVQGGVGKNIRWAHPNSGFMGTETTPRLLTHIPNIEATLNIKFEHTSAVKVQNAQVIIYDRTTVTKNPSGVTCQSAELIHTSTTPGAGGSGDTVWHTTSGITGTPVALDLISSPESGGERTLGGSGSSMVHDWFLAISASPDSIGSKDKFSLYVSTEYL